MIKLKFLDVPLDCLVSCLFILTMGITTPVWKPKVSIVFRNCLLVITSLRKIITTKTKSMHFPRQTFGTFYMDLILLTMTSPHLNQPCPQGLLLNAF